MTDHDRAVFCGYPNTAIRGRCNVCGGADGNALGPLRHRPQSDVEWDMRPERAVAADSPKNGIGANRDADDPRCSDFAELLPLVVTVPDCAIRSRNPHAAIRSGRYVADPTGVHLCPVIRHASPLSTVDSSFRSSFLLPNQIEPWRNGEGQSSRAWLRGRRGGGRDYVERVVHVFARSKVAYGIGAQAAKQQATRCIGITYGPPE